MEVRPCSPLIGAPHEHPECFSSQRARDSARLARSPIAQLTPPSTSSDVLAPSSSQQLNRTPSGPPVRPLLRTCTSSSIQSHHQLRSSLYPPHEKQTIRSVRRAGGSYIPGWRWVLDISHLCRDPARSMCSLTKSSMLVPGMQGPI
jgi:hypothetical protein